MMTRIMSMLVVWALVLSVGVWVVGVYGCHNPFSKTAVHAVAEVASTTSTPAQEDHRWPSPVVGIPYVWAVFLIAGLAIIIGPAIAYFLGELRLGIILALSGASCILFFALLSSFIVSYPWALWIPFGLATLLGLWVFIGWWRGVQAKIALKAIVPATNHSLSVKAAVLKNAGTKLAVVRKAVNRAKIAAGIPLGDGK